MARIKLAYIGGGSTRAPGTMASLIEQGNNFSGSEVVLIDLDPDRLSVVRRIAQQMARHRGLDLVITATLDRREGLEGCDAVLTSFRPGGFEARYLDESLPLKHGMIGQETQGPGGFFMALRSICVMQHITRDMQGVCPSARLFNYTNPINIVSEAVTHYTDIPTVSLCEGPIIFPRMVARAAGLDPERLDCVMIGLNHASWSVHHCYDGADAIPLLRQAYESKRREGSATPHSLRLLHMTALMGSIPADYFQYYYFQEEMLLDLQTKSTTRSQDIMARLPENWAHYREQASSEAPCLDPNRSRGGIHELELAIDVIDAVYNNRGEIWPVNVPNRGAIPNLPSDRVVEIPGYVDRDGATPVGQAALPRHLAPLVGTLAEYQALTAFAAWEGNRIDAIRALAANPLVLSARRAEAVYDEMSRAHSVYLPERLLA